MRTARLREAEKKRIRDHEVVLLRDMLADPRTHVELTQLGDGSATIELHPTGRASRRFHFEVRRVDGYRDPASGFVARAAG